MESSKMAEDRRIRYTKMVLKDSLIKLMKEKPISRISIKSICEEADINRATYYTHYKDQHDQLDQIEFEFVEGIEKFLEDMPMTIPLDIITKIFDYIQENKELCCTLLGKNGDMAFEENVSRLIRSTILASWKIADVEVNSVYDYSYTYTFAGSIGIVKKWLSDDNTNFSTRDIAKLVLDLSEKGISKKRG